MEETPDNAIYLRASGLRLWVMAGLIPSVPILALSWFQNDLLFGVLFIIGVNIGAVVQLLVMGVRRYDVAFKGDSIRGPVKTHWLYVEDSLEIDLRQIDFAHSGRFLILHWRLKLLDGHRMLLSSAWYPRRQIRNLYEELQRRASSLQCDAAPPARGVLG